jgi:hypothetical protein
MGSILKEHVRDEHGKRPEPKLPSSLKGLIPKKYLHVHKQDFSEESVKKWIAARKRRYPTKDNIQKRMMNEDDNKDDGDDDNNNNPTTTTTTPTKKRKLCRYYMKGSCKQGTSCKFEHDDSVKVFREERTKRRKLDSQKGLLKALLQKDIEREHEILLQAVRYLVRKTDFVQS